jgi:hypothetical protein
LLLIHFKDLAERKSSCRISVINTPNQATVSKYQWTWSVSQKERRPALFLWTTRVTYPLFIIPITLKGFAERKASCRISFNNPRKQVTDSQYQWTWSVSQKGKRPVLFLWWTRIS